MSTTQDEMIKAAARERLFDAALAEAVLSQADRGAGPSRGGRWLAAALVLLGGLITVGVALLQKPADRGEVQEPEAFDPIFPRIERCFPLDSSQVTVRSLAEVQALPANTTRIAALTGDEATLDAVTRLDGVRALVPFGQGALTHEQWQRLGALPNLEELVLPSATPDPRDLRELRRAPRLHTLILTNTGDPFPAELANALCELPRLRQLMLARPVLTVEGIAALGGLPDLEAIWIEGAEITEECATALCSLRTLRCLYLEGPAQGQMNAALPLDRLRDLPRIQTLNLRNWVIEPADLGRLPRSLEMLHLGDLDGLTAEGLVGLAELPHLRGLGLNHLPEELVPAAAELLAATKLERFESLSRVAVPPAIWEALRNQARLRRLDVTVHDDFDAVVAHCAELPSLEVLRLIAQTRPTTAQLAPLKKLSHLRRLTITVAMQPIPDRELAELRELLGPDVEIHK